MAMKGSTLNNSCGIGCSNNSGILLSTYEQYFVLGSDDSTVAECVLGTSRQISSISSSSEDLLFFCHFDISKGEKLNLKFNWLQNILYEKSLVTYIHMYVCVSYIPLVVACVFFLPFSCCIFLPFSTFHQ